MGIMLDNIKLGGGPNPEIVDYVIYFDSADATDHSHAFPNITLSEYQWYRIYKSGWVIQGGFDRVEADNTARFTIHFPITMANTLYTTIMQKFDIGDSASLHPQILEQRVDSFDCSLSYTGNTEFRNCFYTILGYMASTQS